MIVLLANCRKYVHRILESPNAKKELSEEIVFCDDHYEAVKGSDALLIATDWSEFKKVDF